MIPTETHEKSSPLMRWGGGAESLHGVRIEDDHAAVYTVHRDGSEASCELTPDDWSDPKTEAIGLTTEGHWRSRRRS